MRLICAGFRTGKTSSGFPRTVLGSCTLGEVAAVGGCSLADMVLRLCVLIKELIRKDLILSRWR